GAPGAIAALGDGFVVESELGNGFVIVGASDSGKGSNGNAVQPVAVASGDDHLGAGANDVGVVSSGGSVQFTRFSATGGALAAPVTISTARAYTASAIRVGDAALVAWATYDAVCVAGARPDGTRVPQADLEAHAPKDTFAAAFAPANAASG